MSTDGTEQTRLERLLRHTLCTWKWETEQDHSPCSEKQHKKNKKNKKSDSLWTFWNVKDLGLPTSFWRESRASWFSVLLYSAIMTSKRSFRWSFTCRETEIIGSQMVLGNRLIVMKWQLEEYSLSHGRHIQRWRLQFQWWRWEREEQQTRRKQRGEVNDKSKEWQAKK